MQGRDKPDSGSIIHTDYRVISPPVFNVIFFYLEIIFWYVMIFEMNLFHPIYTKGHKIDTTEAQAMWL